jgi:hypothetical protein
MIKCLFQEHRLFLLFNTYKSPQSVQILRRQARQLSHSFKRDDIDDILGYDKNNDRYHVAYVSGAERWEPRSERNGEAIDYYKEALARKHECDDGYSQLDESTQNALRVEFEAAALELDNIESVNSVYEDVSRFCLTCSVVLNVLKYENRASRTKEIEKAAENDVDERTGVRQMWFAILPGAYAWAGCRATTSKSSMGSETYSRGIEGI